MENIPNIESTFSPEKRKEIWRIVTTPLTNADREKLKKEIILKGLQSPNAEFNSHGLRFDIGYLNRIGGTICLLPLEFMSEYVDTVCKSSMDSQDGLMEEAVLDDDMTDEYLEKNIDATALGNMAYIILHTQNDMIKGKCLDTLWRYINIYIDNIVKMMIQQSTKRPIQ